MQAISTQNAPAVAVSLANRKAEAIATLRAAIDAPPGLAGATSRTQILAARRAHTARHLVSKLESVDRFYPGVLDRCIAEHGTATRADICAGLRGYFAAAYELNRLDDKRRATAAKRNGRLLTTDSRGARAAAALAAKPQADATDAENEQAAAGFAKLMAAGAFD